MCVSGDVEFREFDQMLGENFELLYAFSQNVPKNCFLDISRGDDCYTF